MLLFLTVYSVCRHLVATSRAPTLYSVTQAPGHQVCRFNAWGAATSACWQLRRGRDWRYLPAYPLQLSSSGCAAVAAAVKVSWRRASLRPARKGPTDVRAFHRQSDLDWNRRALKHFSLSRQTCPTLGPLVYYRVAFLNVPFVTSEAVEGAQIRQPVKPCCSAKQSHWA